MCLGIITTHLLRVVSRVRLFRLDAQRVIRLSAFNVSCKEDISSTLLIIIVNCAHLQCHIVLIVLHKQIVCYVSMVIFLHWPIQRARFAYLSCLIVRIVSTHPHAKHACKASTLTLTVSANNAFPDAYHATTPPHAKSAHHHTSYNPTTHAHYAKTSSSVAKCALTTQQSNVTSA